MNRFISILTAVAGITLYMLSTPLHAARPFVTDDARLTTAESCQVESWTRAYRQSTEFWALPACNPGGNLEITLGGGHISDHGGPSTRDHILQGKTLFKSLESNGYGVGFALGLVDHPGANPGPNQFGNRYAYIPVSVSTFNDKVIVHLNMGLLKDKQSGQTNRTFGLGTEITLSTRILGIAELYGDDKNKPYAQVGARFSIIPDLFQIDSTVGFQHGGPRASQFLSIGIRFTPDGVLSKR